MPTPRPPTPPDLSVLPEPLRQRFLRLYRVFAAGLFLAMGGASVAALSSGLPRRLGLAALLVGALVAGGTFLYALRSGQAATPPPIEPPVPPPSGDGALDPPG